MATLANFPNLRPSLYMDFANSRRVDPRITCVRNTTASRYNAIGGLEIVPANVPRIDYDPGTGECKGLLIEEQRTNLALQSGNWTITPWVAGVSYFRTLVASTHPQIPQGSTVTLYGPNTGVVSFTGNVLLQSTTLTAGRYTLTQDLKAAGIASSVRFQPADATTGSTIGGIVSLVDGAILNTNSSPGATFAEQLLSARSLGNGWFRITLTFTALTNVTFQVRAFPYSGLSAITGDGTSGLQGTMYQIEAGAFPTSHIPTTTAQVTRAADDIRTVIAPSLTKTFVLEATSFANYTTNANDRRNVFSFYPTNLSGAGQLLLLYLQSDGLYIVARAPNNNLTTRKLVDFIAVTGMSYKIALAINGSSVQAAVNGVVGIVNTDVLLLTGNPLTTITFGAQQTTLSRLLNGTEARMSVYETALTQANIQALTAI